MYIGVYQPIFKCRDKGFNFLGKALKNDLETYFGKKAVLLLSTGLALST